MHGFNRSTRSNPMISYAQNFEDVMLWRALGHVEKGFYIDIGAQDPIVDSVSLLFHEKGWRGIHVEPTPRYAQLLRAQRPGDMVIEAAVANTGDMLAFFEIPNTGVSTADPKIAEQHRARGLKICEITVPCIRLSSIFKTCGKQETHWMKIDVEGFEWNVLSSWGNAVTRPWIVVVESTLPMTQIESHQRWEPLLLKRGYAHVYFDGLNRYYVSQEKTELKKAFSAPPNVFDNFSVNGTASTTIHHLLKARHAAEVVEIGEQVQRADSEIQDLKRTLTAQVTHHKSEMQEHLCQLSARKEEIVQLQNARAAREEKLTAEISAQSRHKEELLHQIAATEHATAARLLDWQQTANQERDQFHHRYFAREAETAALALLVQEEHHNQLEIMGRNVTAESTRIATIHAEQLHSLRQQLVEQATATSALSLAMEQKSTKKLESLRCETDAERLNLVRMHQIEASEFRRALLTREREFSAQMLAFHEQAARAQWAVEADSTNRIVELSRLNANEIAAVRLISADMQKYLLEQLESIQRSYDESHEREHGLKAQIDSLNSSLFILQQRAHSLRLHISAVNNSLSWRLTWPVRKVASYLFPSQAVEPVVGQDLIMPSFQAKIKANTLQGNVSQVSIPISFESIMQPKVNKVAFNGAFSGSNIKGVMTLDNQEFVERAYQLVFGRVADPEGGAHCLEQLRKGSSRLFILSQLRLSPEGTERAAKYLELDAELAAATNSKPIAATFVELMAFQGPDFIRAIYYTMLGRDADNSGLKNCIAQMCSGAAKIEILAKVKKSREYQLRTGSIRRIMDAVRQHRTSKNSNLESLIPPPDIRVGQADELPTTTIDLMTCDDQEFLQSTFMLVLGRAPDPEAFGTYLRHLTLGASRLQLLEAIEGSLEARNRAAFIASIERAIRQYRIVTVPIIGPFLRIFMSGGEKLDSASGALRAIQFEHAFSIERLDQIEFQIKEVSFIRLGEVEGIEHQLAAIDEKVAAMKDDSVRQFDQIQENISALHRLTIEQHRQMLDTAQSGTSGIAPPLEMEPTEESEGLRNLSPGARDIYTKLKAASTRLTSVVR